MLPADSIVKMDGEQDIKVAKCRCTKCDNIFLVIEMGENEPSYCCYCGIKFQFYTDTNGTKRNIAGLPTDN